MYSKYGRDIEKLSHDKILCIDLAIEKLYSFYNTVQYSPTFLYVKKKQIIKVLQRAFNIKKAYNTCNDDF